MYVLGVWIDNPNGSRLCLACADKMASASGVRESFWSVGRIVPCHLRAICPNCGEGLGSSKALVVADRLENYLQSFGDDSNTEKVNQLMKDTTAPIRDNDLEELQEYDETVKAVEVTVVRKRQQADALYQEAVARFGEDAVRKAMQRESERDN